MGTLKKRIEDPREITDPNVVKVVTDQRRRCHLFLALPHSVRAAKNPPARLISNTSDCTFTGGIFCWRIPRCRWVRWKPAERLEQLRALENGYRIRVVETEYESLGVDTPEDLERVSTVVRRLNSYRGMGNG